MTQLHHPQAKNTLPQHSFRRTAIAGAVLHLLLGVAVLVPSVAPTQAHAQAAAPARVYNIPAGQLTGALNRFGREAGIMLSFTTDVTDGRQTRGLQGSHTPSAGLNALLIETGLQAIKQKNGGYVLQQAAESSPRETTLAPVTVSATRDLNTEGSGSYAARGASILKGAQALKDIPQSVTIITRQQMDDQRLDSLDDVLANTPGITLRRRPGGGNDILSRGFDTNTIQYDGVPLQRSYSNGNMRSANMAYLDRVEILRGAQGLLEGAGSPAGAINLVRKRGLDETTFSVEGRVGSWNNYGTRFDAGGALNEAGTLRGRAVLDYEDKKSFIEKVWDKNVNAYVAVDMDLGRDTTAGLGFSYSRLNGNSGLYYGVPRYANGTVLPLPRSANLDADWAEATRKESQFFVDLEHRFNPDWKLKFSGVYIDETYDAETAFSYFNLVPVGGSTVSPPGFIYDFGGKSKGADLNLNGKLQALGLKHEVVVGGSYANQNRADAFKEYSNTTANVFNYNAPIAPLSTRTLSRTRDLTANTTQKGIYGLWRTHLTDRATVMFGGRVSWYQADTKTVNPATGAIVTSSHKKESAEFTPYGGIIYALSPEWSAYASYAEIFEPQTAMNAQLQILTPMTGRNYEIGLKGELFNGALNTAFAIYRAEQNDRAVTDYDSPMICGSGASYCSRAAGKVLSEGVDITASGNVTNRWMISAGYTFNRNNYLFDQDATLIGRPFNYEAPRHMFRFWSNYQLPVESGKWAVGAGLNYRSEQRTNSATMLNLAQGGYAVWNARVAYQLNKTWSAALNIENLFDKHYYSSIANNYLNNYVGEPRNAMLTLRGTFK